MTETTAAGAPSDERLVRVGPLSRLLTRPDIGALLGALAVFFAFGIVRTLTLAPPSTLLTPAARC